MFFLSGLQRRSYDLSPNTPILDFDSKTRNFRFNFKKLPQDPADQKPHVLDVLNKFIIYQRVIY